MEKKTIFLELPAEMIDNIDRQNTIGDRSLFISDLLQKQLEQELAAVFGIRSIPSFMYVPMKGNPTMAQGVGRSAKETKQMFTQNIELLLLN